VVSYAKGRKYSMGIQQLLESRYGEGTVSSLDSFKKKKADDKIKGVVQNVKNALSQHGDYERQAMDELKEIEQTVKKIMDKIKAPQLTDQFAVRKFLFSYLNYKKTNINQPIESLIVTSAA
jgi:hypothetical protein